MCCEGWTHFQFSLKEFHAGNEMCNSSLVQSKCNCLLSQCGIKCHHCNEFKTAVNTLFTLCNRTSCNILYILTWEIAPEACLGSDHPLCSGFTKDCNIAFRLLPQSCQSTAKLSDYGVQVIVREPSVLSQDQLAGEKSQLQHQKSLSWWASLTKKKKKVVMGILTFLNTLPVGWISFSSLSISRVPRHCACPKRCTACSNSLSSVSLPGKSSLARESKWSTERYGPSARPEVERAFIRLDRTCLCPAPVM